MRVLVTGAAGFIGSNLCQRLNNDEHEVFGIDVAWEEEDICDDVDQPCDWLFNLACDASPKRYQQFPFFTLRTNFTGTWNCLENALRYNAKMLQASTSEVYGDPLQNPQREDYWGNVNPVGPRSCYDEGKRIAETLCYEYKKEVGVDVRIARIFNTYGPGMDADDGRVVSNFIVQALRGEPLTIYGQGMQTRSFCYIDDLLDGFMTLINADEFVTNLGNPTEFTVYELAELVLRLTGSKSKMVFLPLPQDDPQQRKPDITKAKALGWEPKISLEDGLKETIKYFKGIV